TAARWTSRAATASCGPVPEAGGSFCVKRREMASNMARVSVSSGEICGSSGAGKPGRDVSRRVEAFAPQAGPRLGLTPALSLMFAICSHVAVSVNREPSPMLGSRRHRHDALEALRQQVARFETRPLLAEPAPETAPAPLATPPGHVHEVCADSLAAAGAALGFALAQAQGLRRAGRPGLVIAQLRGEAQELGLPYGAGFAGFGVAAEAVTLIRAATITELLWALEEALACRAVA